MINQPEPLWMITSLYNHESCLCSSQCPCYGLVINHCLKRSIKRNNDSVKRLISSTILLNIIGSLMDIENSLRQFNAHVIHYAHPFVLSNVASYICEMHMIKYSIKMKYDAFRIANFKCINMAMSLRI